MRSSEVLEPQRTTRGRHILCLHKNKHKLKPYFVFAPFYSQKLPLRPTIDRYEVFIVSIYFLLATTDTLA